VIDEAHQLPDVAAQFLGYNVSTRQLSAIARDVSGELLLAQQMGTGVDARAHRARRAGGRGDCAGGGADARMEHAQWPERLIEALHGLEARSRELADALMPLASDGQGAFARLRGRLEEATTRLGALTAEQVEAACAGPRSVRATSAAITRRSTWRRSSPHCSRHSPAPGC